MHTGTAIIADFKDVNTVVVEHGKQPGQILRCPLGKGVLVVGELRDTWPHKLVRSSKHSESTVSPPQAMPQSQHRPEDFEDLINLRVTRKYRMALEGHFCKDGPYRPHIDCCRVIPGAQKDFWCSVPQRDYLKSVSPH